MAAPRVKWKGSQQLALMGRGRWLFSPQEVSCVVRWRGPYDYCLSNRPLIGATVQGYTAYGIKVDHSELEEADGAVGILTITLRNPNTDLITRQTGGDNSGGGGGGSQAAGQAGDPLPEIHWNVFRRKIESHPKCGKNKMDAGLGGSTDGHITSTNYDPQPGGWTFEQYNSLVKAGETEYDEPQPVLSLTTEWYTKPTDFGKNNYQVDVPPANMGLPFPDPINGAGPWTWIRGGDSLTRQNNRWHLHESWTGYRPGTELTTYQLLYGAVSK